MKADDPIVSSCLFRPLNVNGKNHGGNSSLMHAAEPRDPSAAVCFLLLAPMVLPRESWVRQCSALPPGMTGKPIRAGVAKPLTRLMILQTIFLFRDLYHGLEGSIAVQHI
jgi:hypothetical protein